MDARNCRNCVYAAFLQVAAQTVLVCANRPGQGGRLTCIQPDGTCERFYRAGGPRARPVRVPAPPPPNDEVRYISLTKGRFAIVDAADYEELSKYRWHWHASRGGSGYARRGAGGGAVFMHRQIMKAPKGMVVDHIDGNGLNNRRSNLRLCKQRQNLYNQGPRKTRKSHPRFKGVGHNRGESSRPYAQITYRGKVYYLGRFDTEVAAAKAYDRKAVELFGEFAYLNFPEDYGRPPREQGTREKVEGKKEKAEGMNDK